MPRYRRIPLSREKALQAAATSVIVGAGVAAVTYVVARLMLQRDPLLPSALPSGMESSGSITEGDRATAALGPAPDSPGATPASGADAEAE